MFAFRNPGCSMMELHLPEKYGQKKDRQINVGLKSSPHCSQSKASVVESVDSFQLKNAPHFFLLMALETKINRLNDSTFFKGVGFT